MNQILYYGGFALAITLFIMSLVFFIVFRVPSIHRYFRRNSRKGLVAAEAITGKLKKKAEGPKRLTRAEYESRTEVITLSHENTDRIDPDRTDYLATDQMNTQASGKGGTAPGDDGPAGKTELL